MKYLERGSAGKLLAHHCLCLAIACWLLGCGDQTDVSSNLEQTTTEEALGQTESDLAGDQVFRGHLVWGHEVRSFTECDSRREGWVVDATGRDLQEVYSELSSAPYQSLFVVVRGRWRTAPQEGFGADYAEQIEVVELRRAALESKGCAEDLAGIDYVANGNEPFWRVEIRKTGIQFSALGRFETLEFPPPHVSSTAAMTLFRSAREGQDPDRIEVELTQRRCTDSMSGSRFSLAAKVRVAGSTFDGCALAGW